MWRGGCETAAAATAWLCWPAAPPGGLSHVWGPISLVLPVCLRGGGDGGGGAACSLAKKGLNVVIVARSQEKLAAVAAEIKAQFPDRTITPIVFDFAKQRTAADYNALAARLEGLDIGVLINNVGVSYPGALYFGELEAHQPNAIEDLVSGEPGRLLAVVVAAAALLVTVAARGRARSVALLHASLPCSERDIRDADDAHHPAGHAVPRGRHHPQCLVGGGACPHRQPAVCRLLG